MNHKMEAFLRKYDPDELRIASEFLSNWLPFLSSGICETCKQTLSDRIRLVDSEENSSVSTLSNVDWNRLEKGHGNCFAHPVVSTGDSADDIDYLETYSSGTCKDEGHEADGMSDHAAEESPENESGSSAPYSGPRLKKSWADIVVEDELAEQEENENGPTNKIFRADTVSRDETSLDEARKVELTRDQREYIRFRSVKRKKDFKYMERVRGKVVNILEGLELHTGVFSAAEQTRIVSYVEQLREAGMKGQLKDRTYSAPNKWMRGKGRVTLQFGCCYNYATDKYGNLPGIMKDEIVDPLPPLFKVMIKRLVRWHVLPPSYVPDSCIVNIYEEGDCIPPHIDNHDFVRPFCTVSFLCECRILFGSNLKIVGPGEFAGSLAIPLPVGSVLVLKGNGADVAKHCVPAVPAKRISITFRRMDKSKRPTGYVPEPDLQGLQPLSEEANGTLKYNDSRSRHSSLKSPDDRADSGRVYVARHPDSHSSGRVPQVPSYSQRKRF